MTKQTKIILAVVAGVLVLCLLACVGGFLLFSVAGSALVANVVESVEEDPVEVQRVAGEIADIDVPAGYNRATSMEILGIQFVIWNNDPQNGMIMLLQMPMQAEVNEQTLRQMQDAMRQQSNRNLRNMRTNAERDLTVRGQPAHMVIAEGEDADSGVQFNQLLLAFQGKKSIALLMMMNPSSEQNLAIYEDLVGSIR